MNQFKSVFSKHFKEVKDDKELEAFFHQYSIGDLLFYREQLLHLYGEEKKIMPHIRTKKLKKEEQAELMRIKTSLYSHIKRKGWNVNTLF